MAANDEELIRENPALAYKDGEKRPEDTLPAGQETGRLLFKAFKDLPGSMPYQGALTANSERVLVPHVLKIKGIKAFWALLAF